MMRLLSPSFTCQYHAPWLRQLLQDCVILVPGLLSPFICPCVWSTIWLYLKPVPLINTIPTLLMLEFEELSEIIYVLLWYCLRSLSFVLFFLRSSSFSTYFSFLCVFFFFLFTFPGYSKSFPWTSHVFF